MQFESLEATCIDYLCGQAQHMDADLLLCLAQLADHLGLSSLLDTAAEFLIALPWYKNMSKLNSLLTLPVYTTDNDRRNRLLHHPSRGAYTELQVLAVLEKIGVDRAECAPALELHKLQPAELQGLFAALVNRKTSGQLMIAAAQQQLVPEVLRTSVDWTRNVWIVHNIMMPSPGQTFSFVLRECGLELIVRNKVNGNAVSVLSSFCTLGCLTASHIYAWLPITLIVLLLQFQKTLLASLWALPAKEIACQTLCMTSSFLLCTLPIPMSGIADLWLMTHSKRLKLVECGDFLVTLLKFSISYMNQTVRSSSCMNQTIQDPSPLEFHGEADSADDIEDD